MIHAAMIRAARIVRKRNKKRPGILGAKINPAEHKSFSVSHIVWQNPPYPW